MKKILSLRVRFILATAAVVLVLSLAYGAVAVFGYSLSFDKTTFLLLRGDSNLFYNLSRWEGGEIRVELPENFNLQSPVVTLIYNDQGQLLWQQRHIPGLAEKIRPEWLQESSFQELEINASGGHALLANNPAMQQHLDDFLQNDPLYETLHSVAVNKYPATQYMPALTLVVVDTIPVEFKYPWVVLDWFGYVLLANLLLVLPLLWLAACWSLRPIAALAKQVRELENHQREQLNAETPHELSSLVSNLNQLVQSERERYHKYRTTLADLTHSLKTPLSVLQSTLRSLRSNKMALSQAEPLMLGQISRISQQIGYYLHRACISGNNLLFSRELHSVAALLDNLTLALNKVYQHKGVHITVDISPEISFIGEQNDFMEIMGNLLDNACKYCLEFVEIHAIQTEDTLQLWVDDDGPGIPQNKRSLIFHRGQRADTQRPGQGIGLSVARDIVEGYDGQITASSSPMGGTRMQVIFSRQHPSGTETAAK